VKCKVPGRQSSDNTVPSLPEIHFISKTTDIMSYLSEAWEKENTVYWCNVSDTGLCFQDNHTKLNLQ
jgi:hypothetical protein